MADIGGKEGLAARKNLARRLTPVLIGVILGLLISAKFPVIPQKLNEMTGGQAKATCSCDGECVCDCGCHDGGVCGCEACDCDCGCTT